MRRTVPKSLALLLSASLVAPHSAWGLRPTTEGAVETGLEEALESPTGHPTAGQEEKTTRRRWMKQLAWTALGGAAGGALVETTSPLIPSSLDTTVDSDPHNPWIGWEKGRGMQDPYEHPWIRMGAPQMESPAGAANLLTWRNPDGEWPDFDLAAGMGHARFFVPFLTDEQRASPITTEECDILELVMIPGEPKNVKRFRVSVVTEREIDDPEVGFLDETNPRFYAPGPNPKPMKLISRGDRTYGAIKGVRVELWPVNATSAMGFGFRAKPIQSPKYTRFLQNEALQAAIRSERHRRRWALLTGIFLGGATGYITELMFRRDKTPAASPWTGAESEGPSAGQEEVREMVDRLSISHEPITWDQLVALNAAFLGISPDHPTYQLPENMVQGAEAFLEWVNAPEGSRRSLGSHPPIPYLAKDWDSFGLDWEDSITRAAVAGHSLFGMHYFVEATTRTSWALMVVLLRRSGISSVDIRTEWDDAFDRMFFRSPDPRAFIQYIREDIVSAGLEEGVVTSGELVGTGGQRLAVTVYKTAADVGRVQANKVVKRWEFEGSVKHPFVIGLATGSTPEPLLAALVQRLKSMNEQRREELLEWLYIVQMCDFVQAESGQPLDPDHERSAYRYYGDRFFSPLELSEEWIAEHFILPGVGTVQEQADRVAGELGGIDWQLIPFAPDGCVALVHPGDSFGDPKIEAAKDQPRPLWRGVGSHHVGVEGLQGITFTLPDFVQMLSPRGAVHCTAFGSTKAEVLGRVASAAQYNPDIPISFVLHQAWRERVPQRELLLDEAAATHLLPRIRHSEPRRTGKALEGLEWSGFPRRIVEILESDGLASAAEIRKHSPEELADRFRRLTLDDIKLIYFSLMFRYKAYDLLAGRLKDAPSSPRQYLGSIASLGLSTRALRNLRDNGIFTMTELLSTPAATLRTFKIGGELRPGGRSFRKSLTEPQLWEIQTALARRGEELPSGAISVPSAQAMELWRLYGMDQPDVARLLAIPSPVTGEPAAPDKWPVQAFLVGLHVPPLPKKSLNVARLIDSEEGIPRLLAVGGYIVTDADEGTLFRIDGFPANKAHPMSEVRLRNVEWRTYRQIAEAQETGGFIGLTVESGSERKTGPHKKVKRKTPRKDGTAATGARYLSDELSTRPTADFIGSVFVPAAGQEEVSGPYAYNEALRKLRAKFPDDVRVYAGRRIIFYTPSSEPVGVTSLGVNVNYLERPLRAAVELSIFGEVTIKDLPNGDVEVRPFGPGFPSGQEESALQRALPLEERPIPGQGVSALGHVDIERSGRFAQNARDALRLSGVPGMAAGLLHNFLIGRYSFATAEAILLQRHGRAGSMMADQGRARQGLVFAWVALEHRLTYTPPYNPSQIRWQPIFNYVFATPEQRASVPFRSEMRQEIARVQRLRRDSYLGKMYEDASPQSILQEIDNLLAYQEPAGQEEVLGTFKYAEALARLQSYIGGTASQLAGRFFVFLPSGRRVGFVTAQTRPPDLEAALKDTIDLSVFGTVTITVLNGDIEIKPAGPGYSRSGQEEARARVHNFLGTLHQEAPQQVIPVVIGRQYLQENSDLALALSGLEEHAILLEQPDPLETLFTLVEKWSARFAIFVGLKKEAETFERNASEMGIAPTAIDPTKHTFTRLILTILSKTTGIKQAVIEAKAGFQQCIRDLVSLGRAT